MVYKNILITLAVLLMSPAACFAEEKIKIDTERSRVSYSVGYQVGSDFRRQGVEINADVLIKGIEDALAEKDPLLSPPEMQVELVDLQKKVLEIQEQRKKEQSEQNLKAGLEFLEENAGKEGVHTLPSGLQYRVVSDGDGIIPKESDTVTVHYRGTLPDGTEFDSSYSRNKPAEFSLSSVIPGWKEALQLMKAGSKWQLFIPPSLAYGDKTMGRIAPNSTLIFDVELLSVESAK